MNMSMKLVETKVLRGTIEVMTGLHIGGGNDSLEIGGMDNPIIRYPHNREPYIPGSSLKGKMRSLLEWELGRLHAKGEVHQCAEPTCPVCRVFGSTQGGEERGPTRLTVRDASLSVESREVFRSGERPLVEEKHENSINRVTAVANPRPVERVVPGTTFDLEIVYRVLDTGDDGEMDRQYFDDVVLKGLKLLELSALGGSGSRGYGKIRFRDLRNEKGEPVELPEA